MGNRYLTAAIQVVAGSRSPQEETLEREVMAVKDYFEAAAIMSVLPQGEIMPRYSESPQVQAKQIAYEKKLSDFVGEVIVRSRDEPPSGNI